jgi:hypothetical protein
LVVIRSYPLIAVVPSLCVALRPISHVMANGASASGAEHAMSGHMSGNPADHRTFEASFRLSRRYSN